MLGYSRLSLATVREHLVARADDPEFSRLSSELLAITSVLGREGALRRTLADAGLPESRRTSIVAQLFSGKVSQLTVEVVRDVVSQRWSQPGDLVDAIDLLGAEAAFIVAERDGRLDAIEDELFTFGRVFEGSPDLQLALTNPGLPAQAKAGIVRDLLSGRSQPETLALIEHLVTDLRGRRLHSAINELVELAAIRRERLVAVVTSARPLEDDQATRLAAVLGRIYHRQVRLQSEINPDVMGGVAVRVGGEVIDGTIAHRLEQARRLIG